MSKQIQDAYIVAAVRTPVARRNGAFRHVRPDDMLARVLRDVVAKVPKLDANEIGDVITGCAMPEAEQGMNVARIGLLLAGLPDSVPGITINRFCASGRPAKSAAMRATLRLSSPAWLAQPYSTSSSAAGLRWGWRAIRAAIGTAAKSSARTPARLPP